MKARSWFHAVVLCTLIAACPAWGAAEDRSASPIELKANELHSDSNSRTATFLGQVVAKQGDVTIYADRLVVRYAEQAQAVERVEASGNVRIVQGSRRGEAASAVYDNGRGVITLEGNPRVYQGNDIVSGRVITYYLDEQKSTVTGGSNERVRAVIHPGQGSKSIGTKGDAVPGQRRGGQ
ncbi:lipopolysaccharide transport periplasmic protein LptA [Geobacter sp. DSM 9736]|uniref:lipopolysaccharide transport periplasmic protein LptA n=1 Tax=Geobacter sp. DSM 9736 TaxID=1277350 RepID=UPI000B50C81B|nr:lipopolysaccharide transport periplasmic protein LptA [Geobacter sp. DSM 9736]SNB46424.1 lipopolysaccharide export system protein LptA [Geobacter sp. DSM 9736]